MLICSLKAHTGFPLQAAAWVERWPLILGQIQDPAAAPRYGAGFRTMNAKAELRTVEVKALKENPDVYGGEEPHKMLVWADSDSWDDHPYWVIDYLEAGGWMKHFPELGYDEETDHFTVHYNPEERNDIRKLVKPDGTEITAEER